MQWPFIQGGSLPLPDMLGQVPAFLWQNIGYSLENGDILSERTGWNNNYLCNINIGEIIDQQSFTSMPFLKTFFSADDSKLHIK